MTLTHRSSRARGHQVFLRFFLSLLAGLFVASCGPTGTNFLANGPGAQLEANDISVTQIRSNDYFNYLCKQASLLGTHDGKYYRCIPNPGDANNWMILTYQGLNDIDRRCDSYLQWLDNKKRSKGPVLSQIAAIDTATTAILGATGVSGAPLTIVAAGFGLVRNSVENYQSRLLLEIESSTINSVVLNEQHRFREKLKKEKVVVDNKPAAEHVLRSYLRICLPFSIETSINNFSTLGSKGIQVNDSNSINWSPVVGATLLRDIPDSGENAVKPTEIKPNPQDKFLEESVNLNSVERAIAGTGLPEKVQIGLCVDDDGVFGPSTRNAIVQAKTAINLPLPSDQRIPVDSSLNSTLIQRFSSDANKCTGHKLGYKSAFERYLYLNEDLIKDLQERLNRCRAKLQQLSTDKSVFKEVLTVSKKFDPETRTLIAKMQTKLRKQPGRFQEIPDTGSLMSLKLDQNLARCTLLSELASLRSN